MKKNKKRKTTRYRLTIAYDGTNYHGWARQNNADSVCGLIEDKLSLIFRTEIQLHGAGRTDAGVHASGQIAHFDTSDNSEEIEPKRLLNRLSKFLPIDIRVLDIDIVSTNFDSRFSALRRAYEYRICTADYGVMPLDRSKIARWYKKLDIDKLNYASQSLIGVHDFAGFCKFKENATTIRHLQKFTWEQSDEIYTARIEADAFCWSMVRALVGAVTSVAEGRKDMNWLSQLLARTFRESDYTIAPAHGLSLIRVDYPETEVELIKRNALTRNMRKLD